MKLTSVVLASLCAVGANAQYFSAGWTPGAPVHDSEPVPTGRAPPAESLPEKPPSSRPSLFNFDFEKLLTAGPVSNVFEKIGVNISDRIEKAKQAADFWDHRVPLITDSNYEELIVNEELSPEEEVSRVWFLVVSVSKGQNNGLSKLVDDEFDAAFNQSMIAGDLPDVRWGRIDYLNVTYLTTKWAIWQAPYLMAISDHGQSLRFYKASQVRLNAEVIREFLKEEGWRNTEPWNSSFAPGGSNEHIMHYFALVMKQIYDLLVIVPRWAMMLISGALASLVMRVMHRNDPIPTAEKDEKKDEAQAPASTDKPTEATATGASAVKGKGKQRKGGKK